ncbi:hypothetical protein A6U98_13755 [Rhizobium sp. WYCCWR10014]|uniref:hypothetical protein n=1 Tax=Rhizobium sp. WYCCWR10014 TaxID=1825933 RepID=UPI0007E4ACBC|nr:hypothetical protein [Rhizobium sp. WYCCWR10014]OAV49297.1 hypothetical protein A6U98_13755 [Rhizobium sp. WYCCWR10014]
MAATDPKAQALSDARARILKLQEQMTDRVLQMAVEVEKLMGIVPPAEAKAFLKARCNLPAVELSTYVGFAKSLKGSQDILRDARRRSKGFTYAPVPKAAPTDAVNEGFVPVAHACSATGLP